MGICASIIPAMAVSLLFKQKLERAIPVTNILMVLLVYFVSLFSSLKIGAIVLGILVIASAIFDLIIIFKQKGDVKRYLSWYALVAYFIIILFSMWISVGRDLADNDSWYCWGLVVKSYARNFDVRNLGTAICPHPTLIPIWNFLAVETWIGFSDGICLFAKNYLMLSLLLPLLTCIRKSEYKRFIVMVLFIICFPFIDGGYKGLAVDLMMAFMLFDALFYYIEARDNKTKFDIIAVIGFVCAIILTKRIGIVVAMLAMVYIFFCELQSRAHDYALIGVLVSSATVAYLSWNGLSMLALAPIFSVLGAVGLKMVLDILARFFGNEYLFVYSAGVLVVVIAAISLMLRDNTEMAKEFANNVGALFNDKNLMVILLMLFGTLFYKCWKRENNFFQSFGTKNEIVAWISVMVAYFLIIQYVGIAEIPGIGIEPRYYYPIVVPCILLVLIFAREYGGKEGKIIFLIILVLIINEPVMFNVLTTKAKCMEYYGFDDAGIELKEGDSVYFINEVDDNIVRDRQFYFYVFPAKTNLTDKENWMTTFDNSIGMTSEEFSSILLDGYDYVYLQTHDENFIDSYGDLFDDVNNIRTGSVYYVTEKDKKVKLVLAGQ